MLSIDISHVYEGYVEIEKKQAQMRIWSLMVSIFHSGVIFQIYHVIEKIDGGK